jgi:mannose-6-phosphate isomerase-like protein (cupin superfamily)
LKIGEENMAEAPAQIVGFGTGSTSYDAFLEREGIPVVRELWVKNVLELPLAHWKRKGGRGTYINLHGSGINTSYIAIDCFVVEIPPGGRLNVERYMYEEILFVLKGRGATDIWTAKTEKQTFEWQEGSLFTIPLNCSHQLFNGDGQQPALILGCSFAPTMINLMHSDDFIFNNDFVFKDHYAGEVDYFRGEGKVIGKKMLETNFIADVRAFDKLDHDPSRGYGRNVQLEMGCNSMSLHMSEFPVGTYKKAHRHEPGHIF